MNALSSAGAAKPAVLFGANAPNTSEPRMKASTAPASWAEYCSPERRLIAASADGGVLDTGLSLPWFEHCTTRMDAMKGVEDGLSDDLLALCSRRTDAARAELQDHLDISGQLDTGAGTAFFDAPEAPPAAQQSMGTPLERSILDLVQAQAVRLQAMADERPVARHAFEDHRMLARDQIAERDPIGRDARQFLGPGRDPRHRRTVIRPAQAAASRLVLISTRRLMFCKEEATQIAARKKSARCSFSSAVPSSCISRSRLIV